MSVFAPDLKLAIYNRTPVPNQLVHGTALCTLDGEKLEPVLVMRTKDGGLRLSADAVGKIPGRNDSVLKQMLGGRKLSRLSKPQMAALEQLIRAHIEPRIVLEDALLGDVSHIEQSPRLDIVKYLPFPVPPGSRCNTLGAAQFTFDGELVEPVVLQVEDGKMTVSALTSLEVPDGIEFDVKSWPFTVPIEDPRLTPDIRKEIIAFTRLAAVRGTRYG